MSPSDKPVLTVFPAAARNIACVLSCCHQGWIPPVTVRGVTLLFSLWKQFWQGSGKGPLCNNSQNQGSDPFSPSSMDG